MAVFLEVVVDQRAVVDRQEIEDALEEALDGLGTVEGGGNGLGVSTIDVEILDELHLESAIRKVQDVCRRRGLGGSIVRHEPDRASWAL